MLLQLLAPKAKFDEKRLDVLRGNQVLVLLSNLIFFWCLFLVFVVDCTHRRLIRRFRFFVFRLDCHRVSKVDQQAGRRCSIGFASSSTRRIRRRRRRRSSCSSCRRRRVAVDIRRRNRRQARCTRVCARSGADALLIRCRRREAANDDRSEEQCCHSQRHVHAAEYAIFFFFLLFRAVLLINSVLFSRRQCFAS